MKTKREVDQTLEIQAKLNSFSDEDITFSISQIDNAKLRNLYNFDWHQPCS